MGEFMDFCATTPAPPQGGCSGFFTTCDLDGSDALSLDYVKFSWWLYCDRHGKK